LDTKTRLTLTALRAFLEEGYEGATLNEIIRRSGLSKGAVYHHFASKEDLLKAVMSLVTDRMAEWSQAQFSQATSTNELLQALFGSFRAMRQAVGDIVGARGETPYSYLEILLYAARHSRDIRVKMGEIYAQSQASLTRCLRGAQAAGEIREDVDCRALAFEIHVLVEGAMLMSVLDSTVDLDSVGERFYQSMWKRIAINP
jgi:AcrR family transcriptional regulator